MIEVPSDSRLTLAGLLFRCPFSLDQPESCQLAEIRRLPVEARFDGLDSRSEAEVRAIVRRHRACLRSRIEAESPASS